MFQRSQVSESLDTGNHSRNSLLTLVVFRKYLPDGLPDGHAVFTQQLAAITEVNTKTLGYGEHELAMVNRRYDFIAQMVGQKEYPLLTAGWAAAPLPA